MKSAQIPGAAGAAREWEKLSRWVQRVVGGPARARVVLLLACVLGLDSADGATVGASAGPLEQALHISNAQLGLLVSIPSIAAALATLPVGVLSDRIHRVRLLAVTVLLWTFAEGVSGFAQSFQMLLLTRVALGAVTAASGPTVASLVGDYFPTRERARVYGYILTGELIGAGFGFVISGEASTISWRAAFFILALPSLALAFALWRLLPEPARGGASRLERGAKRFVPAAGARASQGEAPAQPESMAREQVREQHVAPHEELVLKRDPTGMSLWAATRYVLSIRTNLVLIIASALGYFYFQGIQTFGLVFFAHRYSLSHSAATLLLVLLGAGAVVGVLSGGRLADRLLGRGNVSARIVVGGLSYVIAAILFLPGLLTASIAIALPLYVAAALAFAGRNPPLDAARLDIMHPRLWGRAEAVRTFCRRCAVAAAPVTFGLIADAFGSGHSGTSGQHGYAASVNAQGLDYAFLILLVTVAAGGLLTFRALRTYPADVSTAIASEERTSGS